MDFLKKHNIEFTWREFSGSLGDLGLFIPLVVATTMATGLDIGVVLILAGLMNILTGLLFGQPIPVQPMKALATIAITEGLLKEDIVAAGIWMGIILLIISPFINHINKFISKPIVRGIQLGIGLKLAEKGISMISGLPILGWESISSAILITIVLLIFLLWNKPGLLYIFLLGFLFLYIKQPDLYAMSVFQFPQIAIVWPSPSDWLNGLLKGAIPQMPLTLLNSVIAVCMLSADYFPKRAISPRKMAFSVGLMNLLCAPLGGMPMCHGAGGLAAQYRFGARTGGSVIMLGVLKVMAGLIFGSILLSLLHHYPVVILGPMLIFAGIELAKSVKDAIHNEQNLIVVLITAIFIIGTDTLIGFLVGCAFSFFYNIYNTYQNSFQKKSTKGA